MRTTIHLPYPRSDTDGTPLGIDLHKLENINLVKKVLRQKFRTPHGFTFQDWLQEMLLILWRRNHQPSAYDPRKSKLETYIGIVARSVSLKLEKRYFVTQPQIIYVEDQSFDGKKSGENIENYYEHDYDFDPYENLNLEVDKYLQGEL